MKIIPSLVEPSARELFTRIQFLSPYYKQFQIDIEDGIFIKNKTLSIDEFVPYIAENHSRLSPSYIYDFHFMAVNFETSIEKLDRIKSLIRIDAILLHTALHPKLTEIQKMYPSFRIGLVINPEESEEVIVHEFSLKTVPIIQLMTINPGPQGQPFIPESLNKIERLRKGGFSGPIYIDGAVNEKSFSLLKSHLTKNDVLCPGSYLAKSPKEELKRRVTLLSTE